MHAHEGQTKVTLGKEQNCWPWAALGFASEGNPMVQDTNTGVAPLNNGMHHPYTTHLLFSRAEKKHIILNIVFRRFFRI